MEDTPKVGTGRQAPECRQGSTGLGQAVAKALAFLRISDGNGGSLTPYRETALEILESNLEHLADTDLAAAAGRLKPAAFHRLSIDRLAGEGSSWEPGLEVEVFSLVREAARRAVGLDPFASQLIAGLAMAHGHIAELPTGEGKTLAAVLPASLHALSGRRVHVLTFNDYLARRDAAWMGPAYRMLGLTVGCVQEGMATEEKRSAYACDVTYLTAKEAGFDLLRDGVCLDPADQVLRPFHVALVDEADSILIDEARIPLILAGTTADGFTGLARLAELARLLRPGIEFDVDEDERNIFLTEPGVARAESELGCGNLFSGPATALLAPLRHALHAEHLLRRDVDYIVRNGRVELVDELTGRVADKRHWPDGLQAAVETKEGVRPGCGGSILGSITLQHLLRLYPILCGMTATAVSAADELKSVYGLEVVVVPPNRPSVRIDDDDLIFADRRTRDQAVVAEIERAHATGRPVVVGTGSVEESEQLAATLEHLGIACSVLNARNDEQEAGIIAEAGDLGQVTISTNMAGRGTDIRLGGHDGRNHRRVAELGGLYVIGTRRHESLRIDIQLRGRAGRQGDPGSSRFFLSLEDDLVRRAGIDRLASADRETPPSDEPLDSPAVRRAVLHAQRVAEGACFDARTRVYRYAEVLERQRRQIQERRQELLEKRSTPHLIEARRRERWSELLSAHGEHLLRAVERRLTLTAIDRCWARHLDEMRLLREEIHLVALDGRTPIVEFTRTAIAAFEVLVELVNAEVLELFDGLEITADGVDWEAQRLRGPSATWTYMVNDTAFAPNPLRQLATHTGFGALAALLWSPLLFAWGAYLHWRRRRGRTELGKGPTDRG